VTETIDVLDDDTELDWSRQGLVVFQRLQAFTYRKQPYPSTLSIGVRFVSWSESLSMMPPALTHFWTRPINKFGTLEWCGSFWYAT